jgi:PTS system mannose-specific IIA component
MMIGVVVITHGEFGKELLRTAQDMVGQQERIASFSVTPQIGSDALVQFIQSVQNELGGSGGVLYLVDMVGGTPGNRTLLHTKDAPAEVVTGVNLYMLLSAFKNRGTMDLPALASRVAEDGRKSILLPRALLAKKMTG